MKTILNGEMRMSEEKQSCHVCGH